MHQLNTSFFALPLFVYVFCLPSFERTCTQRENYKFFNMKKYAMKSFSFYMVIPVIFALSLKYSVKLLTLLMLQPAACF